MRKVWISGSNGQLGQAVQKVIDKLEFEMFVTDKEEVDITDIDQVLNFADVNRPNIIINCSGVTDIELCEKDPKLAYKVNAIGARNLSIAANRLSAKMVQISTDDVFDGNGNNPYKEFDQTSPRTVYGASKVAGENYVKEFNVKHFIIRSTWVYGNGVNFVNNFLKSIEEGKELSIAADQFGSPTSAEEFAKFISHIMTTNEYGTYHATCKGVCNRFEFAQEILKLAGKKAVLKGVMTKDSDFSSVRPAFAVLDNFIMEIVSVYDFPDWKTALEKYMKEREV